MALINCPECSRVISDQATACPHCGYPLSRKPYSVNKDSKGLAGISRGQEAEILELLRQGNQIGAVKKYREISTLGLKESLDGVKEIASRHNIEIKKGRGCFIATACYDSRDNYKIDLFKIYRNQVMRKTRRGRLFIRLYYLFSPLPAYLLKQSILLQKIAVKYLLNPLIYKIFK